MSEKIFNHWDSRVDCFDILHPRERQARITFRLRADAPGGKRTPSFFVEPGSEPRSECTALKAAREVVDYYESCLFSSSLGDARALVTYLESVEQRDKLDAAKWRVADLEEQAAKLAKRIEAARLELAELAEVSP